MCFFVLFHVMDEAKGVKVQYVAFNNILILGNENQASASRLKSKILASFALFRLGHAVTASHRCTNR
jgi:hypothetical protein